MSDIPSYEPAFPWCSYSGMTLRDWFAGQALAGMRISHDYSTGPCNAAVVERAWIIADQMLAARRPV